MIHPQANTPVQHAGSAAVDSDGLAGPHQQPGCDDQCPGPGSPATTPHVLQQDIQPWQQVSPNSAQPAMSCSTQSRISDGILIQQSSTDVQQQVDSNTDGINVLRLHVASIDSLFHVMADRLARLVPTCHTFAEQQL